MNENTYNIKDGIIYSEKDVPFLPRYLVDNRVACEIDEFGIKSVDYYNSKTVGHNLVFGNCFWGSMKFYLEENHENYMQNLYNIELMPFGFSSTWRYKDMDFKYRFIVVDNSIIIELETPNAIGDNISFKTEFYDAFCFTPNKEGDLRYKSSIERKWDTWTFSDNCFWGGYEEVNGQTKICMCADYDIELYKSERNTKYVLKSSFLKPNSKYSFKIIFDNDINSISKKFKDFSLDKIENQYKRYIDISVKSPKLISPYKTLNDFMSLAPMYHETLKINEYPGAIRAKSTNYWVWGWDGMTSNNATSYWGDKNFVKEMLDFYMDYADDELGIAHSFNRDMKGSDFCAIPAQGMYITLLYLHYSNGGDISKYYKFAAKIFNKICNKEVGDLGFCEGTSLFPDFRHLLDETGDDISGFNNTVFYCAARSMGFLADVMGDTQICKKAEEISQKIEDNFVKLFFDEEKKYIVCSIDSRTLQKRDVYNSNSIKWENDFCADLTQEIDDKCIDFFDKNVVTKAGLREIPSWCHSYDTDANQLHCWWPVTGEYFTRLINQFGRKDLIEKWIGWINYWTEKLMCPEGISCYVDTDKPPLDNWNCLNGTWQAYSMRGWYQGVIHSVVGVSCDSGGLTINPYIGEELELKGLHHNNKLFDIKMCGSGSFIENVFVNDVLVCGTNKLPTDIYENTDLVKIKVNRVPQNPYTFNIISGHGIEIKDYKFDGDLISANLYGHGYCKLKIRCDKNTNIYIENNEAEFDYNENIATVKIYFNNNDCKKIRICNSK